MSNTDTDTDANSPQSYRQQYQQQLRQGPTGMMSPQDPALGFDPDQPYDSNQGPQPPPGLNPFNPFSLRPPMQMAGYMRQLNPPPDQPLRPDQRPQEELHPPAQSPFNRTPQGQPAPPWPPTWQPNRRQWYIPSPMNRGPGGWGRPSPFPMMPPMWQVPSLYSSIGGQMAQMGGWPLLMALGGGLNKVTLAFMNGYMRGQGQFSRQQHQAMVDHAYELEQRTGDMIEDYRRTFAEFGDPDTGTVAPDKIPALKQALMDLAANKYHDQHMVNALNNGDIQAVVRQLNVLDGLHTHLRNSNRATQTEENRKKREDDYTNDSGTLKEDGTQTESDTPPPNAVNPIAPKGDNKADEPPTGDPLTGEPTPPPDEAAPAAPGPRSEAQPPQQQAQAAPGQAPEAQQAAPQQPQPEQPQQPVQLAERGDVMSDAPLPGVGTGAEGEAPQQVAEADVTMPPIGQSQQAQAQAQAPDLAQQSNTLRDWKSKHPNVLNRQLHQMDQYAEQTLLRDNYVGPNKTLFPDVARAIQDRANEKRDEINRILTNKDPNFAGEAVYDAVQKVSPMMADDIKGFAEGSKTPSARALQKPWLFALAHKYDPSLNMQNFKARQGLLISFASGKDGQDMTSVGTAYYHLGMYKKDLIEWNKLSAGQRAYIRRFANWDVPNWVEDHEAKLAGVTKKEMDLWGRMNRDADTALTEADRAIAGHGTVSGRSRAVESSGVNLRPEVAIAGVNALVDQLNGRLLKKKQRFDANMGPHPPTSVDKLFEQYSGSGLIPQDPGSETGPPAPVTPQGNEAVRKAIREGQLPPLPDEAPAAATATPASPTSVPSGTKAPAIGTVEDGYEYTGGDPGDPKSWKKR